jgi:hypothetical protein
MTHEGTPCGMGLGRVPAGRGVRGSRGCEDSASGWLKLVRTPATAGQHRQADADGCRTGVAAIGSREKPKVRRVGATHGKGVTNVDTIGAVLRPSSAAAARSMLKRGSRPGAALWEDDAIPQRPPSHLDVDVWRNQTGSLIEVCAGTDRPSMSTSPMSVRTAPPRPASVCHLPPKRARAAGNLDMKAPSGLSRETRQRSGPKPCSTCDRVVLEQRSATS